MSKYERVQSCLTSPLVRVALLLCAACLLPAAAGLDDLCAMRGPCDELERAHATVVQGEACRSFYSTGQCSGLCTRSLKAMLGRHLWRKCAERCDWPSGLVAAADSWLDMCLARPAPGADRPEKIEIVSHRGQKIPDPEFDAMVRGKLGGAGDGVARGAAFGRAIPAAAGKNSQVGGANRERSASSLAHGEMRPGADRQGDVSSADRGRSDTQEGGTGHADSAHGFAGYPSRRGRIIWILVRIVFVVGALGLIGLSASQGGIRDGLFSATRGRLRGTRTSSALKGGLPAPSSAEGSGRVHRDLASLQRGARRHLKGIRSTVD